MESKEYKELRKTMQRAARAAKVSMWFINSFMFLYSLAKNPDQSRAISTIAEVIGTVLYVFYWFIVIHLFMAGFLIIMPVWLSISFIQSIATVFLIYLWFEQSYYVIRFSEISIAIQEASLINLKIRNDRVIRHLNKPFVRQDYGSFRNIH